MKTKHEDILSNFQTLIESAEETLRTCDTSLTGEPKPRDDDYFSFRTQALNLIQRVCGEKSHHYRALQKLASENESKNDACFFPHCLGVVQAAKRDFERGLLFDLRSVITAEVLGRFIDQGEQSLRAQRLVAATSVGGAVLEEVLRGICDAHEITATTPATLESLNKNAADAGVYNALVEKRIASLADLRSRADQGQGDGLKVEDVEDLLAWIRKFAADHLA